MPPGHFSKVAHGDSQPVKENREKTKARSSAEPEFLFESFARPCIAKEARNTDKGS